MDLDLIINNIEARRKILKLKKSDLATKIGVSANGLNGMIANKSFKINVLHDIASALNIELSVLLGLGNIDTNSSHLLLKKIEQQVEDLRDQVKELQKDKEFFRELYEKERDRNDKGDGKKEGEGGG